MIDTSNKYETFREAKAEALVRVSDGTIEALKKQEIPKGDVLEVARTAGIIAAKKTSELIPLCHPIPIDCVKIEYELGNNVISIRSEVRAIWKTGVEMEALTAVSVAALTVYDMLKPVDKKIVIERTVLLEKSGGKSDFQEHFHKSLSAGVIVISDSTFKGERKDKSGEIIKTRLKEFPIVVKEFKILPDNKGEISRVLKKLADEEKLDIILTTGGTGLGPKDVTPEATQEVLHRAVPGITEALRTFGQKRTPRAMLSRNVAGIRGETLIINLPGSSRGVEESLNRLFPGVLHGIKMLWGEGHNHSGKKKQDD
ncbi:MAG: bifunctional molybdenum cofactor biosynthesis protein MoaC/MoaB [Candidatus Aminicenantes bacterium]|nr:bifunctional molybdenum cofactor biosynthesis protein MoaC/MoaB [Candidatus Aminicenantes bacterium]